jgi:hypothetical protein
MRKYLVGVLVCGFSSAALAEKLFDVSTNSIGDGVGGATTRGPALYSADFEDPPYVLGPIEPQAGWTATGVNDAWASVSNLNPNGGSQHLRTVRQGAAVGGGNRVALTPTAGPQPLGPSTMSIDVFIDATGGADYDVVPQAPSQGFLTARVKFHYTDIDGDLIAGDILILDDPDGPGPGGLAFVASGFEYTTGVYKNLRIEADPVADTLQYYYDGVLIYTGVVGIFAGTAMEQGVVLHDNFQNTALEHGDFDNLTITPEPTGLAALGLGLALMLRRRR